MRTRTTRALGDGRAVGAALAAGLAVAAAMAIAAAPATADADAPAAAAPAAAVPAVKAPAVAAPTRVGPPPNGPPARRAQVPRRVEPRSEDALRQILLHGTEDRRLLAEADKLLELGSLDRAEDLLDRLEQEGRVRPRDLLPRRARLARLRGDQALAVDLTRQALALMPGNPRLLRELAGSLAALDRLPEAREAMARLRRATPDPRSGAMLAIQAWRDEGRPAEGLALCDTVRRELGDPHFLSRLRAACLLGLDRPAAAADEVVDGLRANPLDLPLVRTELLDGLAAPGAAEPVLDRLAARAGEADARPEERILAADLHLAAAGTEAALAEVEPLLTEREAQTALLQWASTLALEAPLQADGSRRRATTELLLEALPRLVAEGRPSGILRIRVLDLLARVAEDALAGGWLERDPERAVARLERVLTLVRQGHPTSPHLYSAQIRLARFLKDELGRPEEAAARLERLLTDLDLPIEGVALARLTLGECYLAADDTARARLVLTRLGRSQQFRAAAGHAHYHLARLDLAEGHWETARDRFATVAMDAPEADYANDALALGLAIADELENPTGGPDLLSAYARAVRWELAARPDSQIVALERFVGEAAARVDLSRPQHLLERGRFELAGLLHERGRDAEALAQCERILLDHPDGRYPAEALRLAGRIHAERGEAEQARRAWERLLVQYPDNLFIDEIREKLRDLGEALP